MHLRTSVTGAFLSCILVLAMLASVAAAKDDDFENLLTKPDFETGTAVQRFSPHVLLVNLLARDIDAAGICSHIRADEELQTIKIIALSNHLSASETTALLQKGFDGYVTKPEDIMEVVRKIEEATAIIY